MDHLDERKALDKLLLAVNPLFRNGQDAQPAVAPTAAPSPPVSTAAVQTAAVAPISIPPAQPPSAQAPVASSHLSRAVPANPRVRASAQLPAALEPSVQPRQQAFRPQNTQRNTANTNPRASASAAAPRPVSAPKMYSLPAATSAPRAQLKQQASSQPQTLTQRTPTTKPNRSSTTSPARPVTAPPEITAQPASIAATTQQGAQLCALRNPDTISKEQLENAKAVQRQRAVEALNAARRVAGMPVTPSQSHAPPPAPPARNPPARPSPAPVSAPASGAARSQAQSQRSVGSVAQTQAPAQTPESVQACAAKFKQEKVIVGFYCQYAISVVKKTLAKEPRLAEIEQQLKNHITMQCERWTRRQISRSQLLDSIADRVRSIRPATARIDLVNQFRVWYQREYNLQQQRGAGSAEQRRQALSSRRTTQNFAPSVRQAAPVTATAGGRGQPAVRTTGANRNALTKEQEALLAARLAEKRVANNSLPGIHIDAGRAVGGNVPAGRGTGLDVAGKSLVNGVPATGSTGNISNAGTGRGTPVPRANVAGRRTTAGKAPILGRDGLGKISVAARSTSLGQSAVMNNAIFTNEVIGGKAVLVTNSSGITKPGTPRTQVARVPADPASSVPPTRNPVAGTRGSPGMAVSVAAKGPFAQMGALQQSPISKRTKTSPVRNKGSAALKKPSGAAGTNRVQNPKVPQARLDLSKRPTKKAKRAETGMDELSVMDDIIDIEDEENNLLASHRVDLSGMQEVSVYGKDMLLEVPRLIAKMKKVIDRMGLEGFGTEAMELISLAARERLATIIESLQHIVDIRTNKEKETWRTRPIGPNIYESMVKMREDEERTHQVAAEVRLQRRKLTQQREEEKLAKEKDASLKKSHGSSAATASERKQQIALMKKKQESANRSNALSVLIGSVGAKRKKANSSKSFAPIAALPPLRKKTLPPIPMFGSAGAASAGNSWKNGNATDSLEKLNSLAPLVKLGVNDPRNMGSQSEKDAKRPVKLQDCLYLWRNSQANPTGPNLLYKWSARLGTRDA